ncbi:nitrate reductase, alpha chain [Companilactobacillus nodensis DSM 19682 = JCM 14932 = NBRC 107160]|uniref:nitrate reductase (quinone) n=1 Tax=Companilactobacillus nodensis DSM 19682 = JCM 14932 = NBRC 107160 TaxID=1423775 RepID=A0A0R1K8Z9_9LACO|nr:nitrate reductase subunit alpha [Companilactobacillus nodensis]KRK80069.1 nitrate reductase, alpha chain [Companilactobacillus nodensis DSM 19682 = JCM 14932 = NBRC 107160]
MLKSRFFKKVDKFNGNFTQLEEHSRRWEKLYKERWAHDKVVRTTHGVNCTGSCSWNVYVKQGVVTWEHQSTDYPSCGPNMPEYEPRGCPRGASFSWYEYSPLRIKYPYIRERLWKFWEDARNNFDNPIDAWESIVTDPEKTKSYKSVRGHGGLIRVKWGDATEMIAAMLIYTIKKYGPDRIAGFSPIPAMSMLSYSSGARFISLLGGEMLSFYDWYADLPPASPQVWGEQTDVPESADWYNSQYLIMWGSNVPLTRTPDAHFMVEARYKGTKVVSVSPDYAENVKFADNWLAPHPGSDAALAQGMTHVILNEFYNNKQVPYFTDYVKRFTDLPFVIMLDQSETNKEHVVSGRFLRISDIKDTDTPNSEWKPVLVDEPTDNLVVPNGTIGQRWEKGKKWNLDLDGISPKLSFLGEDERVVDMPSFDAQGNGIFQRTLPCREITLKDGSKKLITTVFDLLMAQYGIRRKKMDELAAKGYDDADSLFTPAWQEKVTGVKPELVVQIAQEFAQNAAETHGKSMVIIGAGVNHWFNSDMTYRAVINMLMLTGCIGVQGGGWAHYVGQEKLRPAEGWANISFANDWQPGGARQQQGTSFFYFASDQWKYDEIDNEGMKSPIKTIKDTFKHPADYQQMAIRLGWMPSYPQFDRSSLDFTKQYGTTDIKEVSKKVVQELKDGSLHFAAEAPDKEINEPKAMFIWRSNLFASSGKGQEYFMKHILGAENGLLAKQSENFKPKDMEWDEESVTGKLDLAVDFDFRMVTTPLYSDIVLPAATWYEKEDLSSTDMHPFIHPFNKAVDPLWESQSDWQAFKHIAKEFQGMAKKYLAEPQYDLKTQPLGHDSMGEISQPLGKIKDWKRGEIEPIPGKTMPSLSLVKRDYTTIYDKYVALGPNTRSGKVGANGYSYSVADQYDELKDIIGTYDDGPDEGLPKLDEDRNVAEAILHLSSASNGHVAKKAWESAEEITGKSLADISAGQTEKVMTFAKITAQPSESIPTPIFSSAKHNGDRYSPFSVNIERNVPFRTLTGRQQFYLDHEIFQEYGEELATYKPTLPPHVLGPADTKVEPADKEVTLRYLTPHGKWNIHTTYQDNLYMLTLFRGGPTVWLSLDDAKKIDVKDNDWVELYNKNGVVTARAVVSQRMPDGTMYMYHAQDMEIEEPLSTITGNRGGSHNAPTQIHVKPTQMVGGYAQLSYGFNYYGPIGNQRDLYVNVRKLKEVKWNES